MKKQEIQQNNLLREARVRQLCVVFISAVLCGSASLSAQENPAIEISGGISGLATKTGSTIALYGNPPYSASNALFGWNLSVAKKLHNNLLLVADISSPHAGGEWINGPAPVPNLCVRNLGCGPTYYIPEVRTWAYLFGPRISLRINDKNALFAQALVGGARRKSGELRPPEWGWDWVAVMTGAFSALWACVSKLGLRLAGFRADGTAIPESDSERCSGSDLS